MKNILQTAEKYSQLSRVGSNVLSGGAAHVFPGPEKRQNSVFGVEAR
jgi:hypothetical protein